MCVSVGVLGRRGAAGRARRRRTSARATARPRTKLEEGEAGGPGARAEPKVDVHLAVGQLDAAHKAGGGVDRHRPLLICAGNGVGVMGVSGGGCARAAHPSTPLEGAPRPPLPLPLTELNVGSHGNRFSLVHCQDGDARAAQLGDCACGGGAEAGGEAWGAREQARAHPRSLPPHLTDHVVDRAGGQVHGAVAEQDPRSTRLDDDGGAWGRGIQLVVYPASRRRHQQQQQAPCVTTTATRPPSDTHRCR